MSINLIRAHVLDLRVGDRNHTIPVAPDRLEPLVTVMSPDRWTVSLAAFDGDGAVTAITSPRGQQVALLHISKYVQTPTDLGSRYRLSAFFPGPSPAERYWGSSEPPLRTATQTWTRVERLHQIALSLPRITAPTRMTDQHRAWQHLANRALDWADLPADDAAHWQAVGISEGRDAFRYHRLGHTAEWSLPWIQARHSAKVAEAAVTAGWTPEQCAAMGEVMPDSTRELPPNIIVGWASAGRDFRTCLLACAAGLTADEASQRPLDDQTLGTLLALSGRDIADVLAKIPVPTA